MELTTEQKQAMAIARARQRAQEAKPAAQSLVSSSPFSQTTTIAGDAPSQPTLNQINPFAVSEAGVDIGTPQSRTGTARAFAQGMSLGTSDEMEATIRSFFGTGTYTENLENIRSEMSQYREGKGGEALTQEAAGGLFSPAMLLKAPLAVQQLSAGLRGAVKGGTAGGVYGFATGEGGVENRLEQGVLGVGFGVLLGAPLEKLVSVLGRPKLQTLVDRHKVSPTVESLKTIRDEAYKAVDQEMVLLGPGDVKEIIQRVSNVAKDDFHITLKGAPNVIDRAQKILESVADKGLQLGQTEQMRRTLFKLAEDKRYGATIRKMIAEFDEVVDDRLAQGDSASLLTAREAHKSYAKARTVEEAFQRIPEETRDTAGAFRRVAENLLRNPREMKYFNEFEKELIRKMANGTLPQNMARFVGKLSPTNGGFTAILNAGAVVSNPWLALLSVSATASKNFADKSVVAQGRKLIEQVGGVKKVMELSTLPNAATVSVNGVGANEVKNVFFGDE
jgi:hypothetical protein